MWLFFVFLVVCVFLLRGVVPKVWMSDMFFGNLFEVPKALLRVQDLLRNPVDMVKYPMFAVLKDISTSCLRLFLVRRFNHETEYW